MTHRLATPVLAGWIGLVLLGVVRGEEAEPSANQHAAHLKAYDAEIQGLLKTYCVSCHGPDKQKGDLRLDTLDPAFNGAAAETWHDVLDNLTLGEMPPQKAEQPQTDERRALVDWVRTGVERAARERRGGDHAVIRRLTRYETANTLRDLLGVDGDFTRDLPPESTSPEGFQNNGRVLGISPLQIETYLAAYRAALDQAIVSGPAPEVFRHTFTEPTQGRTRATKRMRPHQIFTANMKTFPREGNFLIRVRASALVPEGQGVPQLQASIGLRADVKSPVKAVGQVDVHHSESEPGVYEFRGRIEEFPLPGHNPKFPGLTITLSNVHDDGKPADKPARHPTINLPKDVLREISQRVKQAPPLLQLTEDEAAQAQRALRDARKTEAKLNRYIETLRQLDPKDPNRLDLAFRLYDATNAQREFDGRLQRLAKDLKVEFDAFRERVENEAAETLADHKAVIARFAGIEPLNRRDKDKVPPPPEGPPRPTIVVESLEFVGPVYDAWPPASHRALLDSNASDASGERDQAEEALRRFISRAFRRPATDADLQLVMPFYDEIRPTGSFEETMRECFAFVLVSPEFLYLFEPSTDDGPRSLNPHELASRLSYFLHATMPDAELTRLADQGKLGDATRLEGQVRRLLEHPRSREFVRHFTDQWLDLSGIDRVAVNPEYYPAFKDALKPMMREEVRAFFGEVLDRNLSALAFLDADFAMLNRPLAAHYGIDAELAGNAFERVALPAGHPRGGLLSSGGVLLLNSTGEDSHPIRRAVWVLDRLLGDPPADPPADVPDLESESPDFAALPLKRQLELHREKEACNDCHRGIDPWGIPFEGFDAVGQVRSETLRVVGRKKVRSPVEQAAELPGGHAVDGLDDLKAHLLQHERRRFARNLTEKLLAYGLGRSLDLADRDAVESLTDQFEASDYKLNKLIVAIVQSPTFRQK